MIISRTPYRVSLLGGGTDYPAWYREHGGAVLGSAINKYCYIFLRRLPPFFSHRHRVVYSQIELIRHVEEIMHPAVRAVMSEMGDHIDCGLEIQHMGDLPARSGLGSSSSFTVGLINALNALQGRMVSAKHLADEAIRIEQDVIKESVGSQDQIWAAHGGLGVITFDTANTYHIAPLIIGRERLKALNDCMLLFFTGVSRFSSTVAERKISNFKAREKQLHAMRQMVDEGTKILRQPNQPLDDLGRLLHEAWRLKRELASEVSNSKLNEIYEAGLAGGAQGGKLLGAGGGGFMLFYARPECHGEIRERLKRLTEVNFEMNSPGSSIILYDPDRL